MPKYHKGFFRPSHPEKYKGDVNNIVYRSSWELTCMARFDRNPCFIEWSSEETVIPYISPKDRKRHRYFVDFKVKKKCPKTGVVTTYLVEVKPRSQVLEPKPKKKVTKKYLYEVHRYGINKAKWDAAIEYCKDRGWQFLILTEDDLNLSG